MARGSARHPSKFSLIFWRPVQCIGRAHRPAGGYRLPSRQSFGAGNLGGSKRGVGCFLRHANCLFQIENSA
jgi:hypothetical protein